MVDFNVLITGVLERLYERADVNGRVSWGSAYGSLCSYSNLTPSEIRALLRAIEKTTGLVSLSSRHIKVGEKQAGAYRKFGLGRVMAEELPKITSPLIAQTACSSHRINKNQGDGQ